MLKTRQAAAGAAHQRINLEVTSHGKAENQRGALTGVWKTDICRHTHTKLRTKQHQAPSHSSGAPCKARVSTHTSCAEIVPQLERSLRTRRQPETYCPFFDFMTRANCVKGR